MKKRKLNNPEDALATAAAFAGTGATSKYTVLLVLLFVTIIGHFNLAYGSISKDIIDELDKALKKNPNNITAYNHAATRLNDHSQYEDSLKICDKALKIDSKNATCYLEKSRAYENLGKDNKALKMVEHSIMLDSKNAFAYFQKIMVLGKIKPVNREELIKLCYKILEMNQKDKVAEAAYLLLVESLNELARYREIIKVSHQYISFYPNVVNYLSLADAYAKIGEVDKYIVTLEKALKIDPQDLRPLFLKTAALFQLQRYTEAIESCNKFLKLQPNNIGILSFKADSLTTVGNYQEALDTYNAAIATKPKDPIPLYLNKGQMLLKLGKTEESIQMFNKILALDPNNVLAYNNLGYALSDLGKYNDAIEAYDKGLKIDPNHKLINANRNILIKELNQ